MKTARRLKILLVEPPFASRVERAIAKLALTEPLALELVAGGISPDHEVRLLDMRVDQDGLAGEFASFAPDVVACGACTAAVVPARSVLAAAKAADPGVTTVIGGHHATLRPDDFAVPEADFAVIGEGEISFSELVDSIARGKRGEGVPGIAMNDGRAMTLNPARPQADLAGLPLARRSLRERYKGRYFRGKWKPVASSYTSRGCPFRCRFCAMWKIWGGAYRKRPADDVAAEIATLEEPYIDFADDNTIQDPVQSEMLARALAPLRKQYKIYARADAVVARPDLVELWADAGLRLALVGFEAFRKEDLRSIRKGSDLAVNEKAMEILAAAGVGIASYFIVDPGFDADDFDSLSEYVEDRGLDQPVFTVLTPFPGTDYYAEVESKLTTREFEKFDLMHPVLPTRLPEPEFRSRFAGLFRRAYGQGGVAHGMLPPEALAALDDLAG